jgi:hypothetical protein
MERKRESVLDIAKITTWQQMEKEKREGDILIVTFGFVFLFMGLGLRRFP